MFPKYGMRTISFNMDAYQWEVSLIMVKTGIFPAIIIVAHQAVLWENRSLSDRVLHCIEPHGKRNTHLQLLQVFPGDNQNIVEFRYVVREVQIRLLCDQNPMGSSQQVYGNHRTGLGYRQQCDLDSGRRYS